MSIIEFLQGCYFDTFKDKIGIKWMLDYYPICKD